MTTVTLQPVDGGTNYYANNGFTNAANMGWDDPSFLPIGPWLAAMHTQTDAARWADLGWNTAYAFTADSDMSLFTTNHISAIVNSQELSQILSVNGGSLGASTVGLLTIDEPQSFTDAVSAIQNTANNIQDHNFWWGNYTWSFDYQGGPGFGGVPAPGNATALLDALVSTPNGTQTHIDIQSIDLYWFAGANATFWQQVGSMLYTGNVNGHFTPDQMARGSNYGDMIDIERSYQAGHFPAPITAYIENGGPYNEDTSAADYITPPELNWAVWSSLIHGAQNIVYFNHSFGSAHNSGDDMNDPYFHAIQPGQTISMYDQTKATDAQVEQYAAVLHSPNALNYVSTPGGYQFGTSGIDLTQGGIETAAHFYNGNYYIFADTRDSLTQTNIQADFTLNDTGATSVTVLGENRTIAVSNGHFTDTFATAATVHIYEVNGGGTINPPPPPPPPPGDYSTSFPAVENPVSDGGHLITSTTPGVNWSHLGLGGSGTKPVAPVDVTASHLAESVDYANVNFGDALAVATGTWSADQSASVVVGNVAAQAGGAQEFEVHLRVDPATGAGYEIFWGYNNEYVGVATWHANGGYTNLNFTPTSTAIHPGDVLTASIHGNVITVQDNGVTEATVTDNTFASGNPGFGFNEGSSAEYGISSFSASNLGSSPPPPPPPSPPPTPAITAFSPNTNGVDTTSTINLTGTAEASSTVNVSDGSTKLGTAAVDSNGHWNFTELNATNGTHVFSATDTDANGTSAASAAFNVLVNVPAPPPPSNLVANGDFETGTLSSWTVGGANSGWQLFITNQAEHGSYAADIGNVGSTGSLTQTLHLTAGQHYELSFWLANMVKGSGESFTAKVGGTTLYSEGGASAHGYVQHTIDFTATAATESLVFTGRNDPGDWHLDNISVVGIAHA